MIAVKDSDFASSVSSGVTIVDFHSLRCGPCRAQGMVLSKMEEKLGKMGVKVCKADVDECRDAATELNVSALPTIVLFKDGKAVKSKIGLMSTPLVIEFLADVVAPCGC